MTTLNVNDLPAEVLTSILDHVIPGGYHAYETAARSMPRAAFVSKRWLRTCFNITYERHRRIIKKHRSGIALGKRSGLIKQWFERAEGVQGMTSNYDEQARSRLQHAYSRANPCAQLSKHRKREAYREAAKEKVPKTRRPEKASYSIKVRYAY